MQPDLYGRYAIEDASLRMDAERKGAGSYSSETKRPISESNQKFSFQSDILPGVSVSGSFDTPPQICEESIFRLSQMHVKAFFYMLTYDQRSGEGANLPKFVGLAHARRADWGNDRMRSFMSLVKTWEPRIISGQSIADGFFKIAIRRHPNEELCWSWALEWNHNFRSVGVFGNESLCLSIADSLKKNLVHLIVDEPDRKIGYRVDKALPESEDMLFEYEMNGDPDELTTKGTRSGFPPSRE
jgi:hypothetical protein